jgi:hypothetical protein
MTIEEQKELAAARYELHRLYQEEPRPVEKIQKLGDRIAEIVRREWWKFNDTPSTKKRA